MLLASVQNFIPSITSEAGLCLTAANWQEAKVSAASYSLEDLFYKPGYELLKKIKDLRHYLGWPGTLILNASSLRANQEGVYRLKSPYDGALIQKNSLELIELILHLKPDAAILPKNILHECPSIWDFWNNAVIPFFYAEDLIHQAPPHVYGVYFFLKEESIWAQMDQWKHVPRYVMGAINYPLMNSLREQGITLIESDEPEKAALQGRVYTQAGEFNVMEHSARLQFEPIDPSCACPTCLQKFTKAYFHYLMHYTPLLCQRLLIQHNAFWMTDKR
jgi:queuine tRNA-ribosyltransferase